MSDTVTLYNNRLGHITLAAPKELPAAARAALQVRLRLAPGASVTVPRDVWLLMAKNAGNQKYVASGEISTRREDVERRRPPTNLAKLNRDTLSAPRGVGDFVHGLRPDPALLRDVEQAQQRTPGAASRKLVAQAALSATQPGDYAGLLAALAAEGVSLEGLRAHLDQGTVKTLAQGTPEREYAPDTKPADESIAAPVPPVVEPAGSGARDDDSGSKHDRSSGRHKR